MRARSPCLTAYASESPLPFCAHLLDTTCSGCIQQLISHTPGDCLSRTAGAARTNDTGSGSAGYNIGAGEVLHAPRAIRAGVGSRQHPQSAGHNPGRWWSRNEGRGRARQRRRGQHTPSGRVRRATWAEVETRQRLVWRTRPSVFCLRTQRGPGRAPTTSSAWWPCAACRCPTRNEGRDRTRQRPSQARRVPKTGTLGVYSLATVTYGD
jgi:hypothetical protein